MASVVHEDVNKNPARTRCFFNRDAKLIDHELGQVPVRLSHCVSSIGKDKLIQVSTPPAIPHRSATCRHKSAIVLGWAGLDWTGLDWTGLDWTGLGWAPAASAESTVHPFELDMKLVRP